MKKGRLAVVNRAVPLRSTVAPDKRTPRAMPVPVAPTSRVKTLLFHSRRPYSVLVTLSAVLKRVMLAPVLKCWLIANDLVPVTV
ncbi:hypothetical protein D3C87_1201240 [compost metagenome]